MACITAKNGWQRCGLRWPSNNDQTARLLEDGAPVGLECAWRFRRFGQQLSLSLAAATQTGSAGFHSVLARERCRHMRASPSGEFSQLSGEKVSVLETWLCMFEF